MSCSIKAFQRDENRAFGFYSTRHDSRQVRSFVLPCSVSLHFRAGVSPAIFYSSFNFRVYPEVRAPGMASRSAQFTVGGVNNPLPTLCFYCEAKPSWLVKKDGPVIFSSCEYLLSIFLRCTIHRPVFLLSSQIKKAHAV